MITTTEKSELVSMLSLARGQYAEFRGDIGVRTLFGFITLDGMCTYTEDVVEQLVRPLPKGVKITIEVER